MTCRSWCVSSHWYSLPSRGKWSDTNVLYQLVPFWGKSCCAFWEQNWHSLGLGKKEDFGSCRETSQHFSAWGNGKSSRDLLLFGSCNLFLSCWEKWWNWGCYLKCLLHRVQLCSRSVTISCTNIGAWVEQPHQCVPQCDISIYSHVHTFLFYICKYRVCTGNKEQVNSADTVYMPEAWALKQIFVFGCPISWPVSESFNQGGSDVRECTASPPISPIPDPQVLSNAITIIWELHTVFGKHYIRERWGHTV